jgi:hypothetical protein
MDYGSHEGVSSKSKIDKVNSKIKSQKDLQGFWKKEGAKSKALKMARVNKDHEDFTTEMKKKHPNYRPHL